jgi:hypothetical protein
MLNLFAQRRKARQYTFASFAPHMFTECKKFFEIRIIAVIKKGEE